MEAEQAAREALQEVLGEPALAALDPFVVDYMVQVVSEDTGEDSDAGVALVDSVGPFLEDNSLATSEEDIDRLCRSIAAAVRARRFPSLAGPAGLVPATSRASDTADHPGATPAEHDGEAAQASGGPGSGGRAASSAGGATPGPGGEGCGLPAPAPAPSLPPGGRQYTHCRPRSAEEAVVGAAVRELAARLPGLDEGILEFMAGAVGEDVDEEDAALEDSIGPFLLDAGCPEDQVGPMCDLVRDGLDAEAASRAHEEAAPGAMEEAKQGEGGMRRLTVGVKLGDLGATEEFREAGAAPCFQDSLEKRRKKEEARMEAKSARLFEKAEEKRVAKEEREREKMRAEVAKQEALNEQLLAINAAPQRASQNSDQSMSKDINVQHLSLPNPAGGEDLLEDAQLQLMHGQRYGLCGKNGAGKSTLLRLIAARRVSGLPALLRILYVAQDSADRITRGGLAVLDAVLASDQRCQALTKLKDQLEQDHANNSDQLASVYEQLGALDLEAAPEKARQILKGLSFTPRMMEAPVSSLSGGWRMRVSLAMALFQEPDVLLLDEPTNHLDLEAVMWLEERLCRWGPRTLVVVSHDRTFLNCVCTSILHLWHRKLTTYAGDFDTFERVKAEKEVRQQRLHDQHEAKKQEMAKFVDKHLHKGQSLCKDDAAVKQAKKVAKQMERLGGLGQDGKKWKLSYDGKQQDVEAVEQDSVFHFHFPDPGLLPGATSQTNVVTLDDIAFHYKDAQGVQKGAELFSGVSFNLDMTSRIALVGANGSGKSTLIKLMLGQLEPSRGTVKRGKHFRVAAFSQHHMDQLDLQQSAVEHLVQHARARAEMPSAAQSSDEVRRRVGQFGLTGKHQTQRMELLSGGQKSRVAFCKATWDNPHMLLLDEPTNHLDVETVDALVEAVRSFKGAVVIVSHDQHFINACAQQLWVVGKRDKGRAATGSPEGLFRFEGNFKKYKKDLLKHL